MQLSINTFKQALRDKKPQIGLWVGLADACAAEALAGTGYDWMLIDSEHAPNDLTSIRAQLQAVAPYPVQPVVRPVKGDKAIIKRILDVGAQTLLVPMVESGEQAAQIVAATRYPPDGVRGVSSVLTRAARWGQVPGYLKHAGEQICVLVQVESVTGLANLEAIVATEGVDGVFIGPSDLAASMGHLAEASHPDVKAAVENAISTIVAKGKAAGILTGDHALARRALELGATFVAVGVDTVLLVQGARALAREFGRDAG